MKINTNILLAISASSLAFITINSNVLAANNQDLSGITDTSVNLKAGTSGLSIVAAPNFNFGEAKIAGIETVLTASGTAADGVAMPAQISDVRGTGQGWHLQVAMPKPFITSVADGNHVLNGAVLKLNASQVTSTGSGQKPGTLVNSLAINDSSQTSVIAAANQGMGSWNIEYTNAVLTVPSGNYNGAYTSTLEWSLIDAP